jgi:hypothetical protein
MMASSREQKKKERKMRDQSVLASYNPKCERERKKESKLLIINNV